jgi:hypothetical protein
MPPNAGSQRDYLRVSEVRVARTIESPFVSADVHARLIVRPRFALDLENSGNIDPSIGLNSKRPP